MARQRYNTTEAELFRPYVHDTHYPDNWNHVRKCLYQCPANLWPAIMCEYVRTCNIAFEEEKRPLGKTNSSNAAGNKYMRIVAKNLMNNDKEVKAGLENIMDAGPRRECSTCAHWRRGLDDGVSRCKQGNASDGVYGLCADWDSRV